VLAVRMLTYADACLLSGYGAVLAVPPVWRRMLTYADARLLSGYGAVLAVPPVWRRMLTYADACLLSGYGAVLAVPPAGLAQGTSHALDVLEDTALPSDALSADKLHLLHLAPSSLQAGSYADVC
jgi:hypothetical protein